MTTKVIECVVCGASCTRLGAVVARAIGWWFIESENALGGTWRCPRHMTLEILRKRLLSVCDIIEREYGAGMPGISEMRAAVEALPDMEKLKTLPTRLRAPLELWLARIQVSPS